MGLFNKLFGQNDKPKQTEEIHPQQNSEACKTEQELIERYGGTVMEKQLDFGDLIGDNNWNINIGNGEISFGENFVFPIQVLGTISHSSQTWLWAWANAQSGLSDNILKDSLFLKKYGEDNGIDLLRNNTFDFSKEDLHLMGIIASGINDSSAYYICDYGQGAMVVIIKSDKIEKTHKNDHLRVLTVFPRLISEFEVNHKFALINYLKAKGYNVSDNENKISATRNEDTITAEFDELSRLTKLNG